MRTAVYERVRAELDAYMAEGDPPSLGDELSRLARAVAVPYDTLRGIYSNLVKAKVRWPTVAEGRRSKKGEKEEGGQGR